jgi:SulP family sulfate permease
MTVVLVPVVAKYGVAALAPLGIIAGALIVFMALARVGGLIDRVPISVMEGFTVGIALVIALQQVPLALGVPKAPGTHTVLVAWETLHKAFTSTINFKSLAVVVGVLLVKFLWNKLNRTGKLPFHLPASIVAIIVATLVTTIFSVHVATIGEIPQGFHIPNNFFDAISKVPIGELAYIVIVIALLGAIESLLSARVADGMAHVAIDHQRPKHQPNRELLGQGLGTIAASIFGGIPATGAIARTSVNVRSGARTRFASMIHALFLLLVVLLLSPLVSHVPTAALAGVLLATSYRIANPTNIREQLRSTWGTSLTFVVTAIAVLAIDLIWGLVIGLVLHAVLKRLKKL